MFTSSGNSVSSRFSTPGLRAIARCRVSKVIAAHCNSLLFFFQKISLAQLARAAQTLVARDDRSGAEHPLGSTSGLTHPISKASQGEEGTRPPLKAT